MKNIILIGLLAGNIAFLGACSGNHPAKNNKDTVINTYKQKKDTSKMDTGKINSADNSGSGGAGNTVDTVKPGKQKK
jgi:hypothetical protein